MLEHRRTPVNTARYFIFFQTFSRAYLKIYNFGLKNQYKLYFFSVDTGSYRTATRGIRLMVCHHWYMKVLESNVITYSPWFQ